MSRHRLLQHNPEPIKIVPAAQRDVWVKRPEHRCYHEDGRGRCRSYDTTAVRVPVTDRGLRHLGMDFSIEWRCPQHRQG